MMHLQPSDASRCNITGAGGRWLMDNITAVCLAKL
jgi:hypothetical protein